MIRTILLLGPKSAKGSGVYGGGVGGYTRNFAAYVSSLKMPGYNLRPVYHSVRGDGGWIRGNRLARLISDSYAVLCACRTERPFALHVLAQYRSALPRELLTALICRSLKVHFIYDIKAGSFEKNYKTRSPIYRASIHFILKNATAVLVEGRATKQFLNIELSVESYYFPNFVPVSEIPKKGVTLFEAAELRVLFVGYCYENKGVAQLVEGCQLAAQEGVNITLTLIGEEHPKFSLWIGKQDSVSGFRVIRKGRASHEEVLAQMKASDIYAYPTSHPGEGHSNSINEAMMYGLVILTTQHGFLADVLSGGCALFLDSASKDAIASNLIAISIDKKGFFKVGARARQRLIKEYTSQAASERLTKVYERVQADHPNGYK